MSGYPYSIVITSKRKWIYDNSKEIPEISMLSKIIKDDVDTAQTHLKVIKNLKRLRQFSEWYVFDDLDFRKSPVVNQLYWDEYSKTMNQDIDLVYGESQLTE